MKHFFIALLVFAPFIAQAHCPIAIQWQGQDYCTDIEWQNGDKKVAGQFETMDLLSPYLIPMKEIPQKWIYSRAEFLIWKNGDHSHTPQFLEGFRIFPYMVMADGMSHSASSQFKYDSTLQKYVISGVALQEMDACWSLRWTTEIKDEFATSTLLAEISDYSNLDDTKNGIQAGYCTHAPPPSEGGGHHHH